MNRRDLLRSLLAATLAPAIRFFPAPPAPKLETDPMAEFVSLLREHVHRRALKTSSFSHYDRLGFADPADEMLEGMLEFQADQIKRVGIPAPRLE